MSPVCTKKSTSPDQSPFSSTTPAIWSTSSAFGMSPWRSPTATIFLVNWPLAEWVCAATGTCSCCLGRWWSTKSEACSGFWPESWECPSSYACCEFSLSGWTARGQDSGRLATRSKTGMKERQTQRTLKTGMSTARTVKTRGMADYVRCIRARRRSSSVVVMSRAAGATARHESSSSRHFPKKKTLNAYVSSSRCVKRPITPGLRARLRTRLPENHIYRDRCPQLVSCLPFLRPYFHLPRMLSC